eukprot:jgi/Tetstr1/422786/TSEL_001290.t1
MAMAKSTASSMPSPALPAEVPLLSESDGGAGEVLASAGATLENSAAGIRALREPMGRATYQFAMVRA